jgi:hypothetical protein
MIMAAVIAVPLGIAHIVEREFRRVFPSTPAEWAWQKAAGSMEEGRWHDAALAKQYRELAVGFEGTGERWGEATTYGPFTDNLPGGQSVVVRQAARAVASDLEGRGGENAERWHTAQGTLAVVMKDWAADADTCGEFRDILVRFIDGPRQGEIGRVGRIYLRRTP